MLSLIPASSAKGHLEAGKDALSKAQTALLDGDLVEAADGFEAAQAEFEAAASAGNNPLLHIPALLPLIGRTPDAVRTLSDIGVRLSSSGASVTRAIAALPGGLDALSPRDGRIPVETLQDLGPVMAEARAQFEQAAVQAEGLATTLVPHQVVEAGDLLRAKLRQALPIVRSADELIRNLPEFAGVDSPKHYFLAPQNPTELRGTGGLLSTYSILTIDNGLIDVGPFEDVKKLPLIFSGQAEWPSPGLEAIYGSFNSAGDIRFSNMTPDGPTAAGFIENVWNQTQPEPIDGVIFVDVQTLRFMLSATDGIEIKGVPYPLNEKNVVDFVSKDAYDIVSSDRDRPDFLGLVGQLVFDRFLKQAHGDRALRALVQASGDGHIILNAVDPALQAAFTAAGITGALPPTTAGDLVAVSVNNIAGNKVDYFIHRHLIYDVQLQADGTAEATLTVSFENTAPSGAEPSYVLGPFEGKELRAYALGPGEALQRAAVLCGTGCELLSATRDGEPFGVSTGAEAGFSEFRGIMRIPPQTTYEVVYRFSLPYAWQGSNSLGTYHLSIKDQPTIVPTTASIRIHAPAGMSISYTTDGMKIEGGSQATWSGDLTDITTFDVRVQRGILGRAWSDLSDFLTEPVITFGG